MSVLGLTGVTAYFGLIEVGRPVAGGTVAVSGAARHDGLGRRADRQDQLIDRHLGAGT